MLLALLLEKETTTKGSSKMGPRSHTSLEEGQDLNQDSLQSESLINN